MFAVVGAARLDPAGGGQQGPATKKRSQPQLLHVASGVAEALQAGAASQEDWVGKAREEKLRLGSHMSNEGGPCLVV